VALIEEAFVLIQTSAASGNRVDVEQVSETILAAWKTRAAGLGFGSSDNQLGSAIAALQQRVWDLENEYRSDATRLTADGHHQAAAAAMQIADALDGFSAVRKRQ
jgi:hypothetical protein